jgi:transcriptional regulator with XRE-family HTH domain
VQPQALIEFTDVGARLAEVRVESGLSQTDFAARLGVSLRAYQSYERAEREPPFTLAVRLYREFGVSPLWLALGVEGGSRRLLTPEESARLSSDLYDAWQRGVDALAVDVAPEFRKTLYRKLSRSTFRDGAVPAAEIAETIEDLKP